VTALFDSVLADGNFAGSHDGTVTFEEQDGHGWDRPAKESNVEIFAPQNWQ